MKVAIVGAGIHGLSLAWALARQGHGVTLIDRGAIPNPDNSSFDQHRLIHDFNRRRCSRLPGIDEAFAAWHEVFRDIGPFYVETGAIRLFADADAAARAAQALRGAGIACRALDRAARCEALPALRIDHEAGAVMTVRGGILLADRIAVALAQWLADNGVTLRPRIDVATIDVGNAAAMTTAGEAIKADLLLVAAGASTAQLLPALAGRIGARRQVVAYLKPPAALRALWRRSPIYLGLGDADDLWGAPPVAGTDLKIAAGCLARPSDPSQSNARAVAPWDVPALLACYRPHLPEIDTYELLRSAVCFYATSADGELIAEPLDGDRRVWVVSGCDGGDYKLAPALALNLASRLTAPAHARAHVSAATACGADRRHSR
jgi:sarcosine oxidase